MANEASSCRACGATDLAMVLVLGKTPLANSLLTKEQIDQPEQMYPLELAFCRACTLVQITETVPPEQLFREYLYFSSFSDTMLQHSHALVSRLIEQRRLGSDNLIVEIASNDGYLLQNYCKAGIAVLGIEPARNVAQVAIERGVRTISEFFNLELARKLRQEGYKADVIHANNVLAHVADLNGVVAGMEALLADDGVAIIETAYIKDLIDRVEFDTIYHEHLCYFSLTALDHLFCSHNLKVVDVERIPIHGGSLRVFAAKQGERSSRAQALLREEAAWGVGTAEFYAGFGARVDRLRDSLRGLLGDLKDNGKRIAAYGASAKGSTLLNYCGIGVETLDFVVDRSTAKQGLYTPGTHLPIYAPQELLEAMPDYTLLLTWNFADEILSQQAAYRQRGGRFIIPVPEPAII